MSEELGSMLSPSISRRTFVELIGVLGISAAAGASLSACAPSAEDGSDASPISEYGFDYDKWVWSCCHVNCGSRCPLKCYVKDGVVVRIDNDNDGSDEFGPGKIYQMRSCVRGRTNRERLYADDRVQKPLRRVAGTKRGEGKYEEISWETAISEIAQTMKDIKEEYGNGAFYIQYGTGELGASVAKSWAPDNTVMARLLNLFGGYLRHYCDYSTGQITWEAPLFNGDAWTNNEVQDWYNSKNIVIFGNNPANTRMSGSAMQYLMTRVKISNPDAHIVVIDPHLTDTAIGVGKEWVPIRPATDDALVAGMIQHLYSEGELDEQWIRSNFLGFYSDTFLEDVKKCEPTTYEGFFGYDASGALTIEEDMSYEAYLNGTGAYEGTGVKTPEWASQICGVPADKIRELAELYVDGPTATVQGWGPQRHSNGGNNTRSIFLIAALTHNVGISGGGTGSRETIGGPAYSVATAVPNLEEKNGVQQWISFFDWYQAIEDYKSMNDLTWGVRNGYNTFAETPGSIQLPAPMKFIWNYGSNVMAGQHGDINDCLRIYNLPDEKDSGLRCVVTVDPWLTPTALISDYILPGTTPMEEDDLATGGSAWTGFALCETKAVDPLFESKPVYEICTLLARELGLEEEFTEGRDQLGWVEWMYDQGIEAGDTNLPPTFEEFRKQGLWKLTDDHTPTICDPGVGTTMATPSGMYEVFSKQAYNLSKQWDLTCGGYVDDDGLDQITGLPIHYNHFEGYLDEETRAEYPFQLIGHHYKQRTHSSYGNVPWMKSVAPQQCWINTQDAAGLGIANGDTVRVSTKRGVCVLPARVTPRIMPGVISIPQGAWYDPASRDADTLGDRSVVDYGGCISVLTSIRPTPISKGNGVHSNLAKVEKA